MAQQIEEIQLKERSESVAQGRSKMEEAMKQARVDLEKEQAKIQSELSSLAQGLQAQMGAELNALKASHERDLKAKIAQFKPKNAGELNPSAKKEVDEYMTNLGLIRQQNLASKQLELERSMTDQLQSLQAQVDGEIGQFQDELLQRYQSEKLNLQLQLPNATDPDEQAKLRARLDEIEDTITQEKEAYSREKMVAFDGERQRLAVANKTEMESYQRELDAEVASKVEAKKREFFASGAVVSANPSQEIRAKIAQIESSMQAEFAAKRSRIEARMKKESDEATKKLQAKQNEVSESLAKLELEITEEINKSLAKMSTESADKLKEVEAKIETTENEIKQIRDGIMEDLRSATTKVAEKKEMTSVVGGALYHQGSKDITEEVRVELSSMGG